MLRIYANSRKLLCYVKSLLVQRRVTGVLICAERGHCYDIARCVMTATHHSSLYSMSLLEL